MAVRLYMDVHVKLAITEQLRLRGVDVLRAQEDGTTTLPDDELLERARSLGRVLFTQDIHCWAMAADWQRNGRLFAGLAYGHQQGGTIGQYVDSLELIAKTAEPSELENTIEYLPY
jgi:hypothetical protein